MFKLFKRKKKGDIYKKLEELEKDGRLSSIKKSIEDNGRARYDYTYYGDDVDPKDVHRL